jgi:hypothetical protein
MGMHLSILALLSVAAAPVDPEVTAFWGPQALKRLSSAKTVELFRVRPHEDEEEKPPPPRGQVIGGYAVTQVRGAVPAERVAALVELLRARSTYGSFSTYKLCGGFHPGIALRFTDEAGATDVLLCFQCMDVGWVRSTPKNARALGQNDLDPSPWKLAVADMDPGHAQLLDAVLALLPDDDLKKIRDDERAERAEDDAFWSLFSPDAGAVIQRGLGFHDVEGLGPALAREIPATDLLPTCFKALGRGRMPWTQSLSREEAVFQAAETASVAQFEASLKEAFKDPVMERGAARVYFTRFYKKVDPDKNAELSVVLSHRLFDKLEPETRLTIVARLGDILRKRASEELSWILGRPDAWLNENEGEKISVSPAGVAYMELARRQVCPPGPPPTGAERIEVEIARGFCGDANALTARSLKWNVFSLLYALGAIEKYPTRRHLDLLVNSGLDQPGVWDEESFGTLRRIAAKRNAPPPPAKNDLKAAKAWWQKARPGWTD